MINTLLVFLATTLFIEWSFRQYPYFRRLAIISVITSFTIIIGAILITYSSPRSSELDVIYSLIAVLLLVTVFFFQRIMLFPTFTAKDNFYVLLNGSGLRLLSKTKSEFSTNFIEFIICTDSYYETLANFHLQTTISETKNVNLKEIEIGVTRKIKFPDLEPLIATPKRITYLFGKKYVEFSFPRLRTRAFLRIRKNSLLPDLLVE